MLLYSGADRLIYSSCSLESLARDAAGLAGAYRIQRAQLFDLFPHTAHFETLVEFVRAR
jgi:23S rRNA (uracil747-C5)-methyltransferase